MSIRVKALHRLTMTSIFTLAFALAPAGSGAGEPEPSLGEDLGTRAPPYVHQRLGAGPPMSLALQYEVGYGSRDSRAFAPEGVEQALRARFQPLEFLALEAFAGVVTGAGRDTRSECSAEVIARALRQRAHGVDVDLGAGYLHDYRGADVPRLRLGVGRAFRPVETSASALVEIPTGAAGRDEVDVMVTLAAAFAVISGLMLRQQIADFRAGVSPGYWLDPDSLGARERHELIEALRTIEALRDRVDGDFTAALF